MWFTHYSDLIHCPKTNNGGHRKAKTHMTGRRSLDKAKKVKNDEFYTQWADIEREMNAYLEFNPDVFRDKVVLLPCDDPEWSNFTKFFALHFNDYGLKKLISTSYAPRSNGGGVFYQPTLFELDDPRYDKNKSLDRGRVFILERKDVNGDDRIDIDDLTWDYLDGDGDFRSAEVVALRDEADIVVTNPPFSLFREFVSWLVEGDVQFSIIGNPNAVTYKEMFPLIQQNKVWLGQPTPRGSLWFDLPQGAEGELSQRDPTSFRFAEGRPQARRASGWYTNIDHGRRHQPLKLLTMEDNRRFSKHSEIVERGYPKYDNYDAIEVSFVDAIPSDYAGVMGVPIRFLEKFSPDQFEIVRFRHGNDDKDLRYGDKTPYFRILIRHVHPEK